MSRHSSRFVGCVRSSRPFHDNGQRYLLGSVPPLVDLGYRFVTAGGTVSLGHPSTSLFPGKGARTKERSVPVAMREQDRTLRSV